MNFYNLKKEGDDSFSIGGKISNKKRIILADPSYDLTFKDIFSKTDSQGITWQERTINLLNSLIYKDKIKEIKALKTEYIKPKFIPNKNEEPLKVLRSDLSFSLKFADEEGCNFIGLVGVEMQLGQLGNFLDRLVNYGLLLKDINRDENDYLLRTLVLGFINTREKVNLKTNSYFLAEFNSKDGSLVKKVDDFMDVVLINLSEISEKLEKNEKIYILGNEVGDNGKNWLKLLSLRHWGKKLKNKFFEIPEYKLNKEINSAIAYLKKISTDQLSIYYAWEDFYFKEFNDAINKRSKELALNMVKDMQKDMIKKGEAKNMVTKAEERMKLKNLKEFLTTKESKNLSLELYETIFKINLSELNINSIVSFWGKDNQEELEKLKNFIAKKRLNKIPKLDDKNK